MEPLSADNAQVDEFKRLTGSCDKILITSHISPDPDALSSVILLGTTLKENYPDKEIQMVIEEEPLGLNFLPHYQEVAYGSILQSLKSGNTGMLILVDANSVERVSRTDSSEIRKFIEENNLRTVIIDHHEPVNKDKSDVYINQGSPAAVQDVYELCFYTLNYKKPRGYADVAMAGLYADTNGFSYRNRRHSSTFKLADELITAGADIERINNLIRQYTFDDMEVLEELIKNVADGNGYTYSFISDEFVKNWSESGKDGAGLHKGVEIFVNGFIRNIGGNLWGFIAYCNPLHGDKIYSASFRSVGDAKDVSAIAVSLGGGGHKPAAGAKFAAGSIDDAISKIKDKINTQK
ncbi:MAG TPA: DHH family phosphoesterase [Candidatus Babeliales bacterium]|nr:DHH family phosphoesterase [Candidatus Babeliales bacterium]